MIDKALITSGGVIMQCAHCSFVMVGAPAAFCPNCGAATMSVSNQYRPAPVRAAGLGTACQVMLGCVAVAQAAYAVARVTGHDVSVVGAVTAVVELATVPVFLAWFHRMRYNAGLWARQRRGQLWSIGAWFTPVVALWFPLQILGDIWHASAPAGERRRGGVPLANAWWACWLLAWATGAYARHITIIGPDGSPTSSTSVGVDFGGRLVSNVFAVAAAVLGLLVVARVSRMQDARIAAS